MSIKLNGTTLAGTPKLYSSKGQSTTGAMTQKACTDSFLNTNQITNCITEIPQDIKLELNNGTLTLKAGSKIYVPNGFEEDGTTKKFDEVTVESDISAIGTQDQTMFLTVNENNQFEFAALSNTKSGSGVTPFAYALIYDTSTNFIKKYDSSSAIKSNKNSFPIAIVTSNTTQIISIDQVFNGFGYIGNITFVLPGVKVLIPNGRNEDGSLNNIEFTETNVVLDDGIERNTDDKLLVRRDGTLGCWRVDDYKINEFPTPAVGHWWYVYDSSRNLNFYSSNGSDYAVSGDAILGLVRRNNTTKISAIRNFYPIKLLDANETDYIGHQAMPSSNYIDLTLGANGTTYTAPADGWFALKKIGNANEIISFDNGEFCTTNCSSTSGISLAVYIPVRKGEAIIAGYSASGSTTYFRFVYAEGSK